MQCRHAPESIPNLTFVAPARSPRAPGRRGGGLRDLILRKYFSARIGKSGATVIGMESASFIAALATSSSVEQVSGGSRAREAHPLGLDVLFDYLPDVYFFVKDGKGRFVRCNHAFLGLAGRTREDEVIGARDSDFFPASLAENYMNDDRVVLRSGVSIIDRVELMRNPNGSIDWYSTTKLPLRDRNGVTIGVAGITRDVKKMNSTAAHFLSWAPVLETILSRYAQPLSVADLAKITTLSTSQFSRKFKKKFHTTPRSYLTNVRMNAACHLLVSTALPLSEIALQTGFYDQSHLSNQFTRQRGMSPSNYRAKYSAEAERAPTVEPVLEKGNTRDSST
jgi:PAS domain S-box-containing protein